jgi:hypothetical protein
MFPLTFQVGKSILLLGASAHLARGLWWGDASILLENVGPENGYSAAPRRKDPGDLDYCQSGNLGFGRNHFSSGPQRKSEPKILIRSGAGFHDFD